MNEIITSGQTMLPETVKSLFKALDEVIEETPHIFEDIFIKKEQISNADRH